MQFFETKFNNKKTILALGAESAGNFCIFNKGILHFSDDFGDLLDDTNFRKYTHDLNEFLKKNKIKPEIILTDLHPLYKTTALGKELAKKFKAKHIHIQHHIAHIFSAIGDKILCDTRYVIRDTSFGIALDGTGYGTDGKIWGGEIFKVCRDRIPTEGSDPFSIERIGHLENQTMIGGDLAIREPARMLISILSKFLSKKEIYKILQNVSSQHGRRMVIHRKEFYTKSEFDILYSQLLQNFNCQETSSTGRVLDAVSILLGFCGNKRNYKHEPIDLLERNSTRPYADLHPKLQITNYKTQTKSKSQIQNPKFILETTPLFEYLIKNITKDKKRLAATAQLYIAQGLYEIIKRHHADIKCPASEASFGHLMSQQSIFLAGGIANNKIISSFFESKPARNASRSDAGGGAYKNRKAPVGDAGLSFGQIFYHLLSK